MVFDTLENLEIYIPLVPHMKAVVEEMDRGDVYRKAPGVYTTPDPAVTYEVAELQATTKAGPYLFHKHRTEVLVVLEGADLLSLAWRENQDLLISYDKESDTGEVDGDPIAVFQGEEGRFAVFFPGEPHRIGVSSTGERDLVRRVAFRIEEER